MSNLQNVATDNGATATASITINAGAGWNPSTAGSSIVLGILWKFSGTNGSGISSVTDSSSQTYTPQLGTLQNVGDGAQLQVYTLANSASITSVTVNFTTTAFATLIAMEESSTATSSLVDQENVGNQTTVTTWTTANITTLTANDICYGFGANSSNSATSPVASGSWVALTGTGLTSGVHKQTTFGTALLGMRQVLSGTATLAATGTTGASVSILSGIVALKPLVVTNVQLLGQSTPTTGSSGGGGTGNLFYRHGGYVAQLNGTATSINLYVDSIGAATTLWLGLFDALGNIMGSGSVAIATGLNTVALPSCNIVAGRTYYPVWQADASFNPVDDQSSFKVDALANTFGGFPSSINYGAAIGTGEGRPSIYVSGPPSATPSFGLPLGGPARVQWHWR